MLGCIVRQSFNLEAFGSSLTDDGRHVKGIEVNNFQAEVLKSIVIINIVSSQLASQHQPRLAPNGWGGVSTVALVGVLHIAVQLTFYQDLVKAKP